MEKTEIYFKPESSGKKDKKDHKFLKLFFFLLFLLIIILIIIWLLRGSKTTSGRYPENIKNESLSCVSNTAIYEKANERIADKRELKINAVFYGGNKLSSIGLIYTQDFDNDGDAYAAEAILHAQFYRGLQNMGYEHSRFNNKFSLMNNVLVLTLRTDANEIDDSTKDYFLIGSDNSLTTLQEYRTNYESQGFACSSSIENN